MDNGPSKRSMNETKSMKEKIFVFDMDGVIVDTVAASYKVYQDFLKSFGILCREEECDELNGCNDKEIIRYAAKKHSLPLPESKLLEQYNQMVRNIYETAELHEGVNELLNFLQINNFKIALASSSKRTNIDTVLDRFGIREFFEVIISGDDVLQAKPSPEIYNAVRQKMGTGDYYVLEDSQNGITSAKMAGMKVIRLGREDCRDQNEQKIGPQEDKPVHSKINADHTVATIMDVVESSLIADSALCKTIPLSGKVHLQLQKADLAPSTFQEKIVNQHWQEQIQKNHSLFNGMIICYKSHVVEDGAIIISIFSVEYKYFLAQLGGKVHLDLKQLAVSGLIIDEHQQTLISRRSTTVTAYKDHYEFVPSGGIDLFSERSSILPSAQDQILQEFTEETGLAADRIKNIESFCLVFDQKNNVYDICFLIEVYGDLGALLIGIKKDEYTDYLVINIEQIKDFMKSHNVVPTSLIMFSEFLKKVKTAS